MSTKKQYTVILPDVIKARSEEEAYDAFLQYMGICHLMGDVTCFDFVEDVEETDIPTADSIKFYDLFSLDSTSKLQVQRCDETAPDDYDDAQAAIEFVRDLENGDPVAIGMAAKLVRAVNMTPRHTPSPWHIAWCKSGAHIYDQGTIAVVSDELIAWKANARLIAAAPELLKTVEELFTELNSAVYAMSSLHAIQRVEATLERARQVVAKIEEK